MKVMQFRNSRSYMGAVFLLAIQVFSPPSFATEPGTTQKLVAGNELKYVIRPKVDIKRAPSLDKYMPRESVSAGEQGAIGLEIYVDETGKPETAQVSVSSGYERLDAAALKYVKDLRFFPGRLAGEQTSMWYSMITTFRISGGYAKPFLVTPEQQVAKQNLIAKYNSYYLALEKLASEHENGAASGNTNTSAVTQ